MLCILEGCDGAGKTTLAAEIQRQVTEHGIPHALTHLGPPASPERALAQCIDDSPYSDHKPQDFVISDRWVWGTPVYGPIYRPDKDLDNGWGDCGFGGFRYLELFGISRGAVVTYIDVDPGVARDRLNVRGDDYIDLDDIERIRDAYVTKVIPNSCLPVFYIKRFEPISNLSANAARIINMTQRVHSRVEHLAQYPQYVGPHSPTKVLLGTRDAVIKELAAESNRWSSFGAVDPDTMDSVLFKELLIDLGNPTTETL